MHLIGNREAENMLFGMAENARMPHAFLLQGPKGVGKASLALEFAKSLLSGGNPASSRRVEGRSHADFLVVEKRYDEKKEKEKREIVVEDARKIAEFLSLTPAEGKRKVVLLDGADEMNASAANSILKILEEPPHGSVLLLVAHSGRVMPTIRSRCVQIRMKALEEEEMEKALFALIPEAGAEERAILTAVSEGSPGLAKWYHETGGCSGIKSLLSCISRFPKVPFGEVMKLSGEISWEVFSRFMPWLLAGMTISAAKGEIFQLAGVRFPARSAEALSRVAAEAEETIAGTEIYNLDQKQAIINILSRISGCYE